MFSIGILSVGKHFVRVQTARCIWDIIIYFLVFVKSTVGVIAGVLMSRKIHICCSTVNFGPAHVCT